MKNRLWSEICYSVWEFLSNFIIDSSCNNICLQLFIPFAWKNFQTWMSLTALRSVVKKKLEFSGIIRMSNSIDASAYHRGIVCHSPKLCPHNNIKREGTLFYFCCLTWSCGKKERSYWGWFKSKRNFLKRLKNYD